jgi:hypothetical protein
MYIKYIIYIFLTAIRPHVYDLWNITKQKKNLNNAMLIFKSLPLWYGNGFFLKIKYYYAFITKQMQKNTFFEWNFIQKN